MSRANIDLDDEARRSVMRRYRLVTKHDAVLYRRWRSGGETVLGLIDCLIAGVSIRHRVAVVHADGNSDVLARHTALRVEPATRSTSP
jgi:predicted nucleic acid-binding protein